MIPTSISFERRYSDDSGVQYAVRLIPSGERGAVVQIEHIDKADIPIAEIDWLIGALNYIKQSAKEPKP